MKTQYEIEDWLVSHPWLRQMDISSAKVVFVRPGDFVVLPSGDAPPDLIKALKTRTRIENGKSVKVLCLEAGLNPSSEDLLAAIGKRAGLWTLWPRHDDPIWKNDVGQFPIVQR